MATFCRLRATYKLVAHKKVYPLLPGLYFLWVNLNPPTLLGSKICKCSSNSSSQYILCYITIHFPTIKIDSQTITFDGENPDRTYCID